MDQETVIRQFDVLENKINGLIKACKQYEVEIAQLRQENETIKEQLHQKADDEKRNEELKALIRTKIDSLMGRLDEVTEE